MSELPNLPENRSDLAVFVAQLRSKLFKTHQEAADHFHLDRSRISHWENGESIPIGYIINLVLLLAEWGGNTPEVQQRLFEETNEVIKRCYPGENSFDSWQALRKEADEYLAKRREAWQAILKKRLDPLEYALKFPDIWSNTAKLLVTLAPKMEQAGFRNEWTLYLERGIKQGQKLDDPKTEAELNLQLGILRQLQGKYDEARNHFETGHKHYETLNDPYNQARALNLLAYVAQRQRRFEEATDLVNKALHLLTQNSIAERAFSYFVLGMVALEKRNWEDAIDFFDESFKLWEEEKDQRMMGRTLTLRGSALHRMENHSEAIKTYHTAIKLLQEVNDPVHKAMAQMNLGNVYITLSKPQEALKYHLQAKQIFHKVQDQLHLAHIHHNIGMAYHQMQQWQQAGDACLRSIELWKRLDNVERLVNSMDELALIYADQGDLLKAKTILEEALEQLDSIKGEPGYDHKHRMISTDLQKICREINREQE